MSIKIWPYKSGSRSAISLSNGLNSHPLPSPVRILLPPNRSRWSPRTRDVVVNWGNASFDRDARIRNAGRVLNSPSHVATWSNKLLAFTYCASLGNDSVCVPPWTVHRDVAMDWGREGHTVVARHSLRGHSGEGIEITTGTNIPSAPLYTKYIKKKQEWRVHFVRNPAGGLSFFYQQKRRREDIPDTEVNWSIRNYDNGFIYAVNNVDEIPDIFKQRLEAMIFNVTADNLDFGAADVMFANNQNADPEYRKRFVLLEINTACGIESPTLTQFYSTKLLELIGGL